MFSTTFNRPTGAAADAKELEYITALHQTSDGEGDDFVDGSIDAEDIKYYLISRYGIDVSTENIQNLILNDLGGGSDEAAVLDICELVAILLIPFFAKSDKEGDDDGNELGGLLQKRLQKMESIRTGFGNNAQMKAFMEEREHLETMFSKGKVIQHVLNIILADSTGSVEPQPITKELMLTIFARYDELDLIQDDDLVEQMIDDVSGGDPDALLDAKSFARALTKDILLYDTEKELRVSTFREDVFGMEGEEEEEEDDDDGNKHDSKETDPLKDGSGDGQRDVELANGSDTQPKEKIMNNVFTFSQVDFLADGMRSKMHLAFVYLSFVFAMFSYRSDAGLSICGENSDTFLCSIGGSVTYFLAVMFMTILFGVPWILLITAGNSLRGDSIKNFILAMIGIWFFVLSPMFLPVEIPPFIDTESLTTRSSDTVFIKIMLYLIAAVLCGFQLQVLLRTLIPSLKNSKSRFLSFLFTKGMVRETFLLKQAVSLKTHNMVKNALDLHFDGGRYSNMKNNQSRSSTNALALLNYSKSTEKTEEVGGILWCWKGYVTRSVIHREGVMVNSRLVLANILQFFLVIILCFWLPNLMVTTMFPIIFPAAMEHEVKSCDQSTFNPDDCYFITLGGIPAGMAVCYNVQVEDESCISEKYFEPVLASLDASNDNRGKTLCDSISNLVENEGGSTWSLIAGLKGPLELTQSATKVADTTLCQGLFFFNQTIWDELQFATGTDATSIPCSAPKESFCSIDAAQPSTDENLQNAMSSLLTEYEIKYKDTMQPLLSCLENYNSTVVNDVFESATTNMQAILQTSAQSSWNVFFVGEDKALSDDFNLNQYLKNLTEPYIGPEFAANLDNIFNYTDIVQPMSAPSVLPNYDIIQLEKAGNDLISLFFLELNNTSTDVIETFQSRLRILPSYVSLPDLPVETLCKDIWAVKTNTQLFVESVGSTPDHNCRAQLTACTQTGICLLGLDKTEISNVTVYTPFRFTGDKCYDDPDLSSIMEAKVHLGAIDTYVPKLWQINLAIAAAVIVSIITLLGITAFFIPNAILTSLKYRSGVLPSLRNADFKEYRTNLTTLTMLVPVVFWSALAMTFLVFFVVCLVVFLLVWKAARGALISLTAIIIGSVITISLKKVLVFFLGTRNYAAFYRRKPAVVNVSSIAFECWNIFLSIAFVTARFGILLFMTLTFIGRLDRPLLADDLGLDMYPHIFRKAILASDAHRHPYIERLGMMYMMKLKHGDKFGKKSSSTWRLLFVFALMPWLRKYRILDKDIDIDENKVKKAFSLIKDSNDQIYDLKEEISNLKQQLKLARKNDDNESSDQSIEIVDSQDGGSPLVLRGKVHD